jgi:alpha-tubulin suppressor-like RCC1 family protein
VTAPTACGVALALSALLGCDSSLAPQRLVTFSDLSTGPVHACAVSLEGEVFCWGSGAVGEFGMNDRSSRPFPVPIELPDPAVRVSVGYSHSCALLSDAGVYCWGWGILGQLGGGSGAPSAGAPRRVVGPQRFRAVSSGWYHTCALAEADAAYCWGSNGQGQLGTGEASNEGEPRRVAGQLRFAQIAAGADHTCAVSVAGEAYCWGSNRQGQLGNGTTRNADAPALVAGGFRFLSVSAGFAHSCGVSTAATLYCWGSNVHGELGNGGVEREGLPGNTRPEQVLVLTGVSAVQAGYQFTCAVAGSARGFCWGAGVWGQLGIGYTIDAAVPQYINAPSGAAGADFLSLTTASAGGLAYACGLTIEGVVFCWGRGPNGELGNPSTTIATSPIRVHGTLR